MLDVPHEWADALDVSTVTGTVPRENYDATHGIVLASGKDFVPNQENTQSGAQKAMRLDGEEWEPVDNLFVWFLPFGNMFGVLTESVSASRAATFADWLTRATAGDFKDPDFAWAARPVIDQSRVALLNHADGLRAVNYAGEFGTAVADASGVRALFQGGHQAPNALRIEIKATLVRGKSGHGDEQIMLDWFNQNFGSLSGQVDKAQVTLAADGDTPATEVDLLHHRITRKTQVRIATGATRAFTPLSAVGSIIEAFIIDRGDLVRLRDNDD
ncbi:hypothetical protein E6C70_14470 [Glaciibacter flavus]|uniref:Uncharacterized protein n=1 Tax=Orlajensenia flava TaxID=2565934 RepID=A0A4S4FJN9_9MICO|nr:hypothetical protein [Glaciibacter flavus]THG30570.1 hypothetical protein E6C70_14470 [Glaciibacter flavus]